MGKILGYILQKVWDIFAKIWDIIWDILVNNCWIYLANYQDIRISGNLI